MSKLLVFLELIKVLFGVPGTVSNEHQISTCMSPECTSESLKIYENINPAISPCDNFYEYACGNFNAKGITSPFKYTEVLSKDQLKAALNETILESDLHPVKLVKAYYQSCMKRYSSVRNHVTEKIKEISWIDSEKFKEYPKENFSLTSFIMDFQSFQSNDGYFFNFERKDQGFIVNQPKFSEEKVSALKEGKFNGKMLNYFNKKIDLAVELGMNITDARVRFNKVLKFEMDLNSLFNLTESEDRISINHLLAIFPSIDWKTVFDILPSRKTHITGNKDVLWKINNLMLNTSNTTLMDYVVWNFVDSIMSDFKAGPKSSRYTFEFEKSVLESSCVDKTKENMNLAASFLYMKRYWNQTIENELKELAEVLRSEKMKSVEADETLSPKLKHKILKILMTLKFEIGSTSDLKEISFITSYYKDLNFGVDDYMQILRKILIHKRNNYVELRLALYNRFVPETFKPEAFYTSNGHLVYISAAFIINHAYVSDRPTALNYGSIGHIIAHEIIHSTQLAFGHGFKSLSNGFYTRYACIKTQYDQYVDLMTKLSVDGHLTLTENVADIEGMKLIYNVYRKWQEQNQSLDENLPYLSFTSNQLLWISFAQTFCRNDDYDSTKYFIQNDEHTVSPFRVNGVVENFSEFSKDFNCPKETKMNQEIKCRI